MSPALRNLRIRSSAHSLPANDSLFILLFVPHVRDLLGWRWCQADAFLSNYGVEEKGGLAREGERRQAALVALGAPHPSSSWIYLCTAPPPKQPVFTTFPAAANIRSAQPATSHQKIPLQALNCQFNLYFASTIGHISGNCLVSRRLPIRYKRLPVPTLTSSSRHLPAVPPPP